MEKLSKKALGCMYVATALWSTFLLAAIVVACVLWFIPDDIMVGQILSFVFGLLILINASISPYFRFHRYRYNINEEYIDIREGYLFVTREIVPIERLHKMETIRGPIDSMFGVAKVRVTTAGGEVTIRFLEQEKAEKIAEVLGKYVNCIAKEQRENDGE